MGFPTPTEVLGGAGSGPMGRDGRWTCQELLGGVSKLAPLDPHPPDICHFFSPLECGPDLLAASDG